MTRPKYVTVNGARVWASTKLRCGCTGYHFPHRRGGGACEHSPRADYYRAKRAGLPESEAQELLSAAQLESMFPL